MGIASNQIAPNDEFLETEESKNESKVESKAEEDDSFVDETVIHEPTALLPDYVLDRRSTTLKPLEFYRRGTIVLERASARQVDTELLNRLRQAKERGLVNQNTLMGITIFAANGADVQDNPFTVTKFPIFAQLAFRRKLYGLLTAEMCLTLVLATVLHFSVDLKEIVAPLLFWATVGCLGAFLLSLGILYLCKYRYPANYIALFFFMVCKAATLVVLCWRFETTLVLYSSGSVTMCMLITVFTSSIVIDLGTPDERPVPIMLSAFLSWLAFLVLSALVYFSGLYPELGYEAMLIVLCFTTILNFWFAFDARSMMLKMAVDEYMQGLIFFYTDLIVILLLLLLLAAMCICKEDGTSCFGSSFTPVDTTAPVIGDDRRRVVDEPPV